MPEEYELMPVYDRRASFHGKARVRVDDLGNRGLVSYGTPVLWWEAPTGRFHRTWDGWSATTGRHVAEFTRQVLNSHPSPDASVVDRKAAWDAMEVEGLPPFLRP